MAENGVHNTPEEPGLRDAPPGFDMPGLSALPTVRIDHAEPVCFAELLQSGFRLAVPDTCTVEAFLRRAMNLSEDYVSTRVQTVFLDGLAVDDLGAAQVRPGSRLALSAALPGLVGATMRRSGPLASLRQGVTHAPEHDAPQSGPFLAEVRLFNRIGEDLAARMLGLGVYVRAGKFLEFLRSRPEQFWENLRSLTVETTVETAMGTDAGSHGGPTTLHRQDLVRDLWTDEESLRLTLAGSQPETGA